MVVKRLLGSWSNGFGLEKFKFSVYLVVPVIAVVVYSQPAVYEWALRKNRYIVYPKPDNVVLLERVEQLKEEMIQRDSEKKLD